MKCCNDKGSCDTNAPCGCAKAKPFIMIILALAIGFGIYTFMNKADERTALERAADAVKALPEGVDKAAQQLEDKSMADKIQESVGEMAK